MEDQQCCLLLALPLDLLRQVFLLLRGSTAGPSGSSSSRSSSRSSSIADAHALRCTCRLARTATSRLISVMAVDVGVIEQLAATRGTLQTQPRALAAEMFRRFPVGATLRSLRVCAAPAHAAARQQQHMLRDTLAGEGARDKAPHLATVQKLVVEGPMLLESTEATLMATTCPCLSHLSLQRCVVSPLDLAPLASLPSLHTLEIDTPLLAGSDAQHQGDGDVLCALSALSLFTTLRHLTVRCGHADVRKINLPALLSALPTLTHLNHLDLSLRLVDSATREPIDPVPGTTHAVFAAAAQLPQLHSLCAMLVAGTLDAGDMDLLGQCHRLRTLRLPCACVSDPAAIGVLAGLPELGELELGSLEPTADCCGPAGDRACAWRALTLMMPPTAAQLSMLPLDRLQRIVLPSAPLVELADGHDAAKRLHDSAVTLDRCWIGHPSSLRPLSALTLTVDDDGTPPETAAALAAQLSPLRARVHQLVVRSSRVHPEVVAALAAALPCTRCLDLLNCSVQPTDADAFCDALLVFPCLQALHLGVAGVPLDALLSRTLLAHTHALQHASLGQEAFGAHECAAAAEALRAAGSTVTLVRRASARQAPCFTAD
ncbi:hypothetical protein FOA52_007814 [Chlamydomonas sp. UWO 241]|nr:hypothetical protein FOA52_007814 [Chlamydomonas sp. UWO 241]